MAEYSRILEFPLEEGEEVNEKKERGGWGKSKKKFFFYLTILKKTYLKKCLKRENGLLRKVVRVWMTRK